MGLDMVGTFSFAVPATVLSLIWSVIFFCVEGRVGVSLDQKAEDGEEVVFW